MARFVVTGPLDQEGYVDYPAALNDRLGKGVKPERNANVLLWKALDGNTWGVSFSLFGFRWLLL